MTRLAQHPGILSYRADANSIGTVTFVTFEAEIVLRHFKDLESEAAIGVSFGLPPDGVRDLAAEYFPPVTGEARRIASELWDSRDTYSKESVSEFLDILVTCIPVKRVPPKGYVSFMEAMLMFPAGRRPWLAVIEAIVYGRVKSVLRRDFVSTPKIKGLLGQISLSGIEQQRERMIADHANAPTYDIGKVSAVAANLMLGIYNHHVFMACAKAGLLTPDDKGAVAYEEVLQFARRHIFANEAAVRARNSSRSIETWLLDRGVKPLFKFDNAKGGVIYDRELVEPHLLLRA